MKMILFSSLLVGLTLSISSCTEEIERDVVHHSTTESGTGEDNTSHDNTMDIITFSKESTIREVISSPFFDKFGRLLFPIDRHINENMTLEDVSSPNVYIWYSHIKAEKTVEIVNNLARRAQNGETVFFNIYTDKEKEQDSSKYNTGLFFFKGNNREPFAVMNAGGGFMYVGAMHDSFPHAIEASKKGYNAFALIYRPDAPYEDLARAIEFIYDNAEDIGVSPYGYSLWGGSAGARMAAVLGNKDYIRQITGRKDIPQASAVIMQYTGYSYASPVDAPTYVCVGTSDGIANYKTMQRRLDVLSGYGIPTEFHAYQGLGHGFGLGSGTVAEGWINDALKFWIKQNISTGIDNITKDK